jgi:hypothetical protein
MRNEKSATRLIRVVPLQSCTLSVRGPNLPDSDCVIEWGEYPRFGRFYGQVTPFCEEPMCPGPALDY